MTNINRRRFIQTAGAAGIAAGAGISAPAIAGGHGGKKHVVVIGGGFGGATAAKYVKKFDSSVKVTLIEASKEYVTCPGSNWVIGGLRDIDSITHSYDGLKGHGIDVIHGWVTKVDPAAQTVTMKDGKSVSYDRLIMSPGIDFRMDAMEGYSEEVSQKIPHAWKAGPQTTLLRDQLQAMPDGGTFVIVPPPNPFRCPPGPGERISMVAHYFKANKPNSKIVALDPKGKFSKQGLFVQGWKDLGYADMIDYRHNFKTESIDAASMTVSGEVEDVKGDVINYIPPQIAAKIASDTGLTNDSGWCPVDHLTWESTIHKNIHVIGDAAIQKPLPKSGYAANSEAKVCAASVVALLKGEKPATPSWVNTCYSLVGPQYGISVAMVYNLTSDGKVGKVKGSGGLTPKDGNRMLESIYAESWYNNIVKDLFG